MGRNLTIESGDRANFYEQAKQRGNNLNAPGMRRAELEFQASQGNQWAKNQLRQEATDKMKVENGNALQAQADADFHGSCADATNFVGDTVTGGAHRNLQDSYEAASHGNYRQAAGHLTKASGKVVWQACTGKLGDGAKALGAMSKTANVTEKSAKLLQAGSMTLHLAEDVNQCHELGQTIDHGKANYGANTGPKPAAAYKSLQMHSLGAPAHGHTVSHKI